MSDLTDGARSDGTGGARSEPAVGARDGQAAEATTGLSEGATTETLVDGIADETADSTAAIAPLRSPPAPAGEARVTPMMVSVAMRFAALGLAIAALAVAFAGMDGSIRTLEVIGVGLFALALIPGLELVSVVGVLCVMIGAMANNRSALVAGAVGLLLLAWALTCDLAESLTLQPPGRRAAPRIRRWGTQAAGVLAAGVAGAVLSVVAGTLDLSVGRNVAIALAVFAPVLAFGALALAWQYRSVPVPQETSRGDNVY